MSSLSQDQASFTDALGAVSTTSGASEVARRLMDLFTQGGIPAGTRLPPERQLSASLGVGRSAVREALAALELLGIVDVRAGSGTYLRGSASELLPQTLSWGLMLGAPRTLELIELRSNLEIFATRLASRRITQEELAELESHLTVMQANLGDLPVFIEADAMFHLGIAEASGNSVLRDLLQSLRSLLRIWVDRGLQSSEHARKALLEHQAVFAALAERDEMAAVVSMEHHMRTAGNRLREHVDAPEDESAE